MNIMEVHEKRQKKGRKEAEKRLHCNMYPQFSIFLLQMKMIHTNRQELIMTL